MNITEIIKKFQCIAILNHASFLKAFRHHVTCFYHYHISSTSLLFHYYMNHGVFDTKCQDSLWTVWKWGCGPLTGKARKAEWYGSTPVSVDFPNKCSVFCEQNTIPTVKNIGGSILFLWYFAGQKDWWTSMYWVSWDVRKVCLSKEAHKPACYTSLG